MEDIYRIRYKIGDFEVEVESTDKSFVETKFDKLIQNDKSLIPKTTENKSDQKHTNSSSLTNKGTDEESNIDIMSVVNAINASDKYDIINKKIIKKSNQLARILMVFYFASKINGNARITTGDVEKITDQLGIKIKQPNAARTLKADMRFFAADSVRKKGTPTKYKLNRKGSDEFEKIITKE
jgi:hypothetical protein